MQVLFMVTKRKNKSLSGRILFIIIMKDLLFYCYKLNYSIDIDLAVGTEIIVNFAHPPSLRAFQKDFTPLLEILAIINAPANSRQKIHFTKRTV
jgi:hypothetical protein